MSTPRIQSVRETIVGISDKSNWIFVELTDEDGKTGMGEATLHGYEPLVSAWLHHHRAEIEGKTAEEIRAYLPTGRRTLGGVAAHAAVSAVNQALVELEARRGGKSVAAQLGFDDPASVELYANINRGLTDRSSTAFGRRAAEAVARGYRQIKMAPFDGVSPEAADGQRNEALLQKGLDRISAAREAIGPDIGLFVDCHWRLTHDRALRLADELAERGVTWYECPLREIPANFEAFSQIRAVANDKGMVLAGAEMEIGAAGFRPFAGLYDVVMPDIKYCGGPDELCRIASMAADLGCRVAPHNPSGPVAHAHSIHASAHRAIFMLEVQFDESPLFGEVCQGALPGFSGGIATVGSGPGLDLSVDHALCAQFPARVVRSLT